MESPKQVADLMVDQARRDLTTHATVGEHLTDQILLPRALVGSGSFCTHDLSRHARTNIEVIQQFLPVRFESTPLEEGGTLVEVVAQ